MAECLIAPECRPKLRRAALGSTIVLTITISSSCIATAVGEYTRRYRLVGLSGVFPIRHMLDVPINKKS